MQVDLEKTDIDKTDINIFYYLITNNKTDALYSAKIGDILEYLNMSVSYYTVVRRVKKLVEREYIVKGYKVSNADTYYLSSKGIDFMKKNILNQDSIYEEISIDNESEE